MRSREIAEARINATSLPTLRTDDAEVRTSVYCIVFVIKILYIDVKRRKPCFKQLQDTSLSRVRLRLAFRPHVCLTCLDGFAPFMPEVPASLVRVPGLRAHWLPKVVSMALLTDRLCKSLGRTVCRPQSARSWNLTSTYVYEEGSPAAVAQATPSSYNKSLGIALQDKTCPTGLGMLAPGCR